MSRVAGIVGRIAVVALALAGGFQVVRSAVASIYVDDRPDIAARAWPDHPRVAIATSLNEIGQSAATGRGAAPATIARAMDAARRAPLSIEPFLIAGAEATSKADLRRSEALFVEARRRDPRSSAARYFLAQRYFTSGRAFAGLEEASVLTRLVSGGSGALVPGLAQYARSPGAVGNLRRMFVSNPDLRDGVLAALANDASNANLVIALAGADSAPNPSAQNSPAPAPAWQSLLIHALIEKGDFTQAHALWRKVSGTKAGPAGLYNPQFGKVAAPPPFNWSLLSGDSGVAEPVAPGNLQIIYYGRANADFATQLLLLAPGRYELRMRVTRDAENDQPSGLAWSLTCQPGTTQLLALPISGAPSVPRAVAGRFTVPAGCPSQLLKLSGTAREFAESEQALIGNLQLIGEAR